MGAIVEAKKDDFEQGLAQCLVEMYACHHLNARQGIAHPIYAIVTNGAGWQFYRYENGQVFESVLFARADTEKLLGVLDCIFAAGAANARRVTQQAAP